MSGMKAGLYYPTWPDMNGELVPGILLEVANWNLLSFIEYDNFALAPALVQFLHRLMAYVLLALIILLGVGVYKLNVPAWYKQGSIVLVMSFIVQLVLGIYTVINCFGEIPIFLGVMHQAGAIILLTALLYMMRSTMRE